jgi:2-oxoglutarate dehydrogenase E2 component (dihydrolipoamide succinyltransferase)
MSELENIPGTGNEGRVTKKDILQYVSERRSGMKRHPDSYREPNVKSQEATVQAPQEISIVKESPGFTSHDSRLTTYVGNVEIIEMDRMRKLIAEHMVRSKHTSPHVTSFTEADVTNLVLWRDKVKKDFEKREGTKITFTPLFIEAIVRCIKKFPLVNCSLDGDKIIIKKDINIGMATALPSGNLIVPVIKNADQLNLVGLTKQVNALADNARNNKLRPEDTQGGTFTLTNVGTFGSLMGTPIINQPQVAILAVGAIKKRPVVVETPAGDSIAIRHMMYLSMSYDHRIVDGSLGATFLTAVAKELENFNGAREY